MGFWRRLLGKAPRDHGAQEAIDAEVQAYVSEECEKVLASLPTSRERTLEEVRAAIALSLAPDSEQRIRKLGIEMIVARARLRMHEEGKLSDDPDSEAALLRMANARFRARPLRRLAEQWLRSRLGE